MNREDDPELWDLLGRAPCVEASPFFARNILREILNAPPKVSWLARWRERRLLLFPALAGAAALLITAAILHYQPRPQSSAIATRTEQPAVPLPASPSAPAPAPPVEVAAEPVSDAQIDDAVNADLKLLAEADDDSDDDALL